MRTKGSRLSSAELCRLNGWRKGDIIFGSEYGRGAYLQLTAIGESEILVKDAFASGGEESDWTLECRNWRRLNRNGRVALRGAVKHE